MDESRTREFKARIGFDDLSAAPADDRGVLVQWSDPTGLPPLTGGGWAVTNELMMLDRPGEAGRKWVLRRDETSLTIEVYVSSTGAMSSRDRIVELASQTMTVSIPHEASKVAIGDLAVMLRNPGIQDLIWAFRNVCVRVRTHGTDPDVVPIAQAIQSLMESHVVSDLAGALPAIERVTVSQDRLRVGETLRCDLVLAGAQDAGAFAVRFAEAAPGGKLSLRAETGQSAEFEGIAPGRTAVQVGIVHRETLLSAWKELAIEVSPT